MAYHSPVTGERGDIGRNVLSLGPPQAEIHFGVGPDESKYKSVRVEAKLAADHHERRSISNLITLIWLYDVTDSAPDLCRSFPLLGIAAMCRGSYGRHYDTKTQSHCSEFHLRCSFPGLAGR
jgi:hypothetical protein